jgi:hypothetical protein
MAKRKKKKKKTKSMKKQRRKSWKIRARRIDFHAITQAKQLKKYLYMQNDKGFKIP